MATSKQIVGATTGGAGVPWDEYLGKLLVVEPLDHEKDIKTQYGLSDAVRANVFVLLGPGKTEEFEDTLIFQNVMIGQLKRQIGKIVVGRLTQGENKKGNPPWIIGEPTASDLDKAGKFWTSRSMAAPEQPARKPSRQAPSEAEDEDEAWLEAVLDEDGDSAY